MITGPVGVMGSPQKSVTIGGVGSIASEGHSTVEPSPGGTVKSKETISIVCVSVEVLSQSSVAVKDTVSTEWQE